MLHRDLDGHNLISVYYGIGPQYYESGCQWGQGDRRQQHSLMIVDDCWWSLMIVDDRWWSLMIVDGDVRYDTSELGKASQSHRWNYFQNHPLPKCSTEGTSLPTKGSWCVSLNGPVVSSSSPCWSFNPMQCWSKVQCAGTDLFADPSLLLAVLLRFDSPPCLSARGGPRRPAAARGGPLCPRRRFVRNDRPVSWGR